MNSKVYRCVMFVPINNPRFTERAWTREADGLILDLEDSVPMAEKERARGLVRETISKAAKGGAAVFVRINHDFAEADLRASIWPGLRRVIFPKAETGEEMRRVDALITELEKERGIPVGTIEITPLIESALGVVNIHEIISATSRIHAMHGGWGYDMAVDLGIEMFASFNQYAYSDGFPTLAQMTTGIHAEGGIFVPNTSGRTDQSDYAANLAQVLRQNGIHEQTVLHPAMVKPLVSGLTPTPDEVAWAEKVVEIYKEMTQDGESVSQVDGKTVDVYEYNLAVKMLTWAETCAEKDAFKKKSVARTQAEESKH